MDDFLEIVECLPQEIRSSFSQMTERDKEFDGINKSLVRQRQKLLGEVQGSNPNILKLVEKISKDEQTAFSMLDGKISICQNLISTLEAYMPILQAEIQKSCGSSGGTFHQPNPVSMSVNSAPSPVSNLGLSRGSTQSPINSASSPLPFNRALTPIQNDSRRASSVDPVRHVS